MEQEYQFVFKKSGKKYRENKSEDSEEELYINNLSDKDLKECKNKKISWGRPWKTKFSVYGR